MIWMNTLGVRQKKPSLSVEGITECGKAGDAAPADPHSTSSLSFRENGRGGK
jgi:hypothetical protein